MISSGKTATGRTILSPFCAMPVLAPYATRSGARRIASQEKLRNSPPARCLCSSLPSKRLRRTAWASTQSSFISTTITSWGFIRGSSCGIGVRARSAKLNGRDSKSDGPDFSGPNNSWANTAPCDSFSIDSDNSQSSYFCREAIPAFPSHRTRAQKDRAWTRRDSNPYLLPSQGAVFPLHHGPAESLLALCSLMHGWTSRSNRACSQIGTPGTNPCKI